MWREEDYVTGFEFQWDAPNEFRGWPREKRRWGRTNGSIRDRIVLRKDLLELKVCIDVDNTDPLNPQQYFRGFRTLEYDSITYQ
jgi:hypothetical protein